MIGVGMLLGALVYPNTKIIGFGVWFRLSKSRKHRNDSCWGSFMNKSKNITADRSRIIPWSFLIYYLNIFFHKNDPTSNQQISLHVIFTDVGMLELSTLTFTITIVSNSANSILMV